MDVPRWNISQRQPHPPSAAAGMFVLTRDIGTGECQALELVPPATADANRGRVSIDSPFGRAVAAARAGATCTTDTIHGTRRFQVISIDHEVEW